MSLPEPSRRLPAAAKGYWRTRLGVQAIGATIAVMAVAETALDGPPPPVTYAALLVAAVAATVLVPGLRWRRWRYEVREEDIDLRHGTFTVRRTLIPMRRIQHVDTESGPLQGAFDLATVSFHTAAGRTEIPAVGRGEADALRTRVGELARVRDDV